MNLKGEVKTLSKFLAKVGLGSTESEDTEWGFVIRAGGKALTVYAKAEEELQKWMTAIGRCIVHTEAGAQNAPVKTGWLVKFAPYGDMEKKLRFVELWKGSLKYYEDSMDEVCKVSLELKDCRVGPVPDIRNTFFIASKEMNNVWHFTAESEAEMIEWMSDLKPNITIESVSSLPFLAIYTHTVLTFHKFTASL